MDKVRQFVFELKKENKISDLEAKMEIFIDSCGEVIHNNVSKICKGVFESPVDKEKYLNEYSKHMPKDFDK